MTDREIAILMTREIDDWDMMTKQIHELCQGERESIEVENEEA